MGDLSNIERGQIVGVHLAEASMMKTTTLLGVLRATVSKAYMKHGKTTSGKRNGW
jgi:hypothetical protein